MEEACTNFRAYLHSSGVSEALSVALLSLYKLSKKPANPIEYIRQNLPPEQGETIDGLTRRLEDLKKDIEKLKKMLPKEVLPEPKQDVDGSVSKMDIESTFDGTETVFSDAATTIAETVLSEATTNVAETVISEATTNVAETVISEANVEPDTIMSDATSVVETVADTLISDTTTKVAGTASISSEATKLEAQPSDTQSKEKIEITN